MEGDAGDTADNAVRNSPIIHANGDDVEEFGEVVAANDNSKDHLASDDADRLGDGQLPSITVGGARRLIDSIEFN